MTSYNTYPILLSALSIGAQLPDGVQALGPLPDAPPQVAYHLNVVQANKRGLKAKEQTFKKKYEKYTKILNQLTWLNACSSRINVATVLQHSLHSSGFL